MKHAAIFGGFAVTMFAVGAGCYGGKIDEGTETASTESACKHDRLTVMTRNVYLGADVDPVLAAPTPEDVPVRAAAAWTQMQSNDFAARADALAKEIADHRPHLVGLQEVALFRRFPASGSAPTEIDFLEVLRSAIARHGASYVVAVVQKDSDVVLPMLAGFDDAGAPVLDGIEMIDRDVVLVRADVHVSQTTASRYAVGIPISLGGGSVEIVRGWASVVAETELGKVRFVTTHLEDFVPEVQFAQASELLSTLEAEKLPVVLVGDFNSPADGSQTATYGLIASSGYDDAWSKAHPSDPGFTCCRPSDLHETSPLTERLDLVFSRNRKSPSFGVVEAKIIGDAPGDRTSSGLWPSDHAGVVVSFRRP